VWLRTTTLRKFLRKVNAAVEVEGTIRADVDPQGFVVTGSIDDRDVAWLDEVVGDEQILLVRRQLHVVRSNSWLVLIRVIKSFDVVQVADVESSNVIRSPERGELRTTALGNRKLT